jgi:hypothetical protein
MSPNTSKTTRRSTPVNTPYPTRNLMTNTVRNPMNHTTNFAMHNTITLARAKTSARILSRATGASMLLLLLGLLMGGCGPSFDPASLVNTTRVIGARVEVDGVPDRATPKPGETATVTWLVTSPQATPPLAWAFAVCVPGTVAGKPALGCASTPIAIFEGTDSVPRLTISVPAAAALGTASALVVYGEICSGGGAMPTFDPQDGLPRCTDGGGTTVSVSVPLQFGDEPNHNPTADRAFTLDGQPWASLPVGADPCGVGPRVSAGTSDHLIGTTTEGSDREPYTAVLGDPPVPTPVRESLQISHFTTAGKLKSQFSFVESADGNTQTPVAVKWNAPRSADVPAAGLPVTMTFVVRDNRGGTDWTTRVVCVGP